MLGAFHDPKEVIAKARAEADGSVSVGLVELLGLDGPAIRIIGDTTDGPVTLDQCLGAQDTYHVPLVLSGDHIPDGEPLRFQAAEFSIRHFVRWSGTSGLKPSLVVQDDPRRIEEIRIVHTPVADTAVDVPHGQLGASSSLHVPWRPRCRCPLSNKPAPLNFGSPIRAGLLDVLQAHHALQALVSIAVATPVRVTETRVRPAGGRWLQVHAQGVGAGSYTGDVPTPPPRRDAVYVRRSWWAGRHWPLADEVEGVLACGRGAHESLVRARLVR